MSNNKRKNTNNYSKLPFFFFKFFMIALFNENIVYAYYILPFKIIRTPLSDLYNIHFNISKDEIFLNYTNNIHLSTSLKINNSFTIKGDLRSDLLCTYYTSNQFKSNLDFNITEDYNNVNISNIYKKIIQKGGEDFDEKNISIYIGFGISQFDRTSECISFVEEVKKNDNTVKSYVWSMNYYSSNNKKDYDGELIIGIEPHGYLPDTFDNSNYMTINNYIDEFSEYYPMYEKNIYGILFNSIYFYDNNEKSIDINIISCKERESLEGFFNMNFGMIKSPEEYFDLIKNYFFNKYINNCKEITFSRYYRAFVCEKKNFNVEDFYKKFPTIYLKNVDFNYIFELTSKDLFKEENDKIYFMIYSSSSESQWTFGEIFLKKYYFTFDQDKKLIRFYSKLNKKKDENKNNDNYEKKGIIILFIAIGLLIINIIIFGIYFWKKCGKNKRKRANELKDDNYEYISDNYDNNNNIINNH